MKKLRRKLGDYFMGRKKKPKGTVKFCPLSPCKGNRTPIFQLHKHLQTSIHGLRPNTPSYIKALNKAPRVSLKILEWHLKNEKEKKKRPKDERRKRQHESSRVTLKEIKPIKEGRRMMEREENSSGDEKHEIEGNRVARVAQGPQVASQRAGTVTEENMELDSDQEYDDLTRRVWEKTQRSRGTTIQTSGIDSDEEVHGQISQSQDFFQRTPCFHDQEAIVVTDSDSDSDVDYIPGGSGADESNDSCSSDSSILSEERKDLLIGVVEVIGRENCDSGSFLDYQTVLPWKKQIQNFISRQERQGYCFKNEEQSIEDLRKHFQQEDSDDEILLDIFMSDESDNDDALDEEWEPSDCEPDAEEAKEHRQAELGAATSTLLDEFYEYLIDVDGVYRSVKVAQQYKSQVQSIIRTCKMKLTESDPKKYEHEDLPSFHVLLIPGMTGVKFLRSWLSYVVKYQPGTGRPYLMSLCLFYKFLSQEEVPLPNVTKDLLNARRDLMPSWSSAQKKKVLKRKLEKHDEDYRKLLSSENLHKVCHGSLHVNAVKQLAATSTETNRGNITEEIISDKSHCEVRDWLMTCILIDNSGRSGDVANMTTGEFKEAVFSNGTDDDPARYRVDVKDHKTAGVYGAAVVWIYDNLYVLIDMYIRTFRSQLIPTDSEVQQVFISSNGLSLTSSQVSYSVFRTFQREGVQVKGRICATTIRKSLATGMHTHMPGQKDHLAALAQHKPETQANYYRVHDKVSQTDLGRQAVKNLVSLKTKQDLPEEKQNVSIPAS